MDDYLYKEVILDLYRNPLNQKILDDFDIEKTGHNPSCGDSVVVRIKFHGDEIIDVGWTGEGCAISIAAISLITDEIRGKSVKKIKNITQGQMIEMLAIPISYTRLRCALLGFNTVQNSIECGHDE